MPGRELLPGVFYIFGLILSQFCRGLTNSAEVLVSWAQDCYIKGTREEFVMEKTTVHDNLHTEVMENVIYIQMLGGFSMTYHGQPVLLGKSLSSKMLHLLMLLIYS